MRPGAYPCLRIIVTDLEEAASHLDLGPDAPRSAGGGHFLGAGMRSKYRRVDGAPGPVCARSALRPGKTPGPALAENQRRGSNKS